MNGSPSRECQPHKERKIKTEECGRKKAQNAQKRTRDQHDKSDWIFYSDFIFYFSFFLCFFAAILYG
jgi:hypothetical protein